MGNLNEKFISETVACNSLDAAIEWISNNLSINDVFDEDVIKRYITENFSIEEIFPDADIKHYVEHNFSIYDIFKKMIW